MLDAWTISYITAVAFGFWKLKIQIAQIMRIGSVTCVRNNFSRVDRITNDVPLSRQPNIPPEHDPLRVGMRDLDPLARGGGMIFDPIPHRLPVHATGPFIGMPGILPRYLGKFCFTSVTFFFFWFHINCQLWCVTLQRRNTTGREVQPYRSLSSTEHGRSTQPATRQRPFASTALSRYVHVKWRICDV